MHARLLSPASAIALALALVDVAWAQAPPAAQAQTRPPAALAARAVALMQACQAGGGRVVNGDRPFVHNVDLNGDGTLDFVMDEAGFGCSNAAVTAVTPDGAPLEVFDGATGQSLYRGLAYTFAVQRAAPRNLLTVTLRGPACGAGAGATTTCQRPLAWNASARALMGAPTIPPAPPPARPAPAAAAPPPVAAPTSAGGLTLSEADRTAAFRAMGFKPVGRTWRRCEEDPPTASYGPGQIEEVLDLNGDGRPEAVITERSTFCNGGEGEWFGIVTKEANGSWRPIMDIHGVFVARDTRANGWREIEVGGPGTGGFPIWRYNGREYVYNRGPR